jgi:hypothetical protein
MFQYLVSVCTKDHGSLVTLEIADIKGIQTYLLHPTTLDSVFQGVFAALPRGAFEDALVVPRAIKEIFVNEAISNTPGHLFNSMATVNPLDRYGCHSSIVVTCDDAGSTVLEVKGLFCQAVSGNAGE